MEINIVGYARKEVDKAPFYKRVLENLLENLDEKYGSPEGDETKETESMIAATKEFIDKIVEEYEPWVCEEVCRETINVKKWVTEKQPEWIEDGVEFEEDEH